MDLLFLPLHARTFLHLTIQEGTGLDWSNTHVTKTHRPELPKILARVLVEGY